MPDIGSMASGIATAAELAVPGLAPFSPLIGMVIAAIKAHYNATGTWPTEAQVSAALPADHQAVTDLWAKWTAAHP